MNGVLPGVRGLYGGDEKKSGASRSWGETHSQSQDKGNKDCSADSSGKEALLAKKAGELKKGSATHLSLRDLPKRMGKGRPWPWGNRQHGRASSDRGGGNTRRTTTTGVGGS